MDLSLIVNSLFVHFLLTITDHLNMQLFVQLKATVLFVGHQLGDESKAYLAFAVETIRMFRILTSVSQFWNPGYPRIGRFPSTRLI